MNPNLKKAIRESGNNLHLKVVDILKAKNIKDINLSCYYYDDAMLKPREIDIIAKHTCRSFESQQFDSRAIFDINLFIECKHFKEEISFRPFPATPTECQNAILIKPFFLLDASKAIPAIMADTKGHVFENSGLKDSHHHSKIANVGRLNDTCQSQEENLFKGITQPVKSFIFNESSLNQGLSYLIVVYEGINGIYEIKEQDYGEDYLDGLTPEKISTLGIKYSYRDSFGNMQENSDFFIDFVHIDEFNSYLEQTVLPETRKLEEFISFCTAALKNPIKRLYR